MDSADDPDLNFSPERMERTPREVKNQLVMEEELLWERIQYSYKFLLYYLIYMLVRTNQVSMGNIARTMDWTPFEVQSIVKLFERYYGERMRGGVDKG